LTLSFISTILLPFADTSDKCWSHLLPAFIMWVGLGLIVSRSRTETHSSLSMFPVGQPG
jgi:hypothetical protein